MFSVLSPLDGHKHSDSSVSEILDDNFIQEHASNEYSFTFLLDSPLYTSASEKSVSIPSIPELLLPN